MTRSVWKGPFVDITLMKKTQKQEIIKKLIFL